MAASEDPAAPAPLRLLFVDDEPLVLSGLRRTLAGRYEARFAEGGAEALALLEGEPFAVIVSDMRMPGMNGAEFLGRAAARWPDTVRLLLTGHADVQSAIQAVNEGNIFRFLTKPCPPDLLFRALDGALEQYRLTRAERELLEGTLRGAVDMLVDLLSLASPSVFQRTKLIERLVAHMAGALSLSEPWRYEVAALLSQTGCITVPPDVVERAHLGKALEPEEVDMMRSTPAVAHRLLHRIPRLGPVADMIAAAAPDADPSGEDPVVVQGAALLRLATAMAERMTRGLGVGQALADVRAHEQHDAHLLDALSGFHDDDVEYAVRDVTARELTPLMILEEDLRTARGQLLLSKGRQLDATVLRRIRNFATTEGLQEPIRIRTAAF